MMKKSIFSRMPAALLAVTIGAFAAACTPASAEPMAQPAATEIHTTYVGNTDDTITVTKVNAETGEVLAIKTFRTDIVDGSIVIDPVPVAAQDTEGGEAGSAGNDDVANTVDVPPSVDAPVMDISDTSTDSSVNPGSISHDTVVGAEKEEEQAQVVNDASDTGLWGHVINGLEAVKGAGSKALDWVNGKMYDTVEPAATAPTPTDDAPAVDEAPTGASASAVDVPATVEPAKDEPTSAEPSATATVLAATDEEVIQPEVSSEDTAVTTVKM